MQTNKRPQRDALGRFLPGHGFGGSPPTHGHKQRGSDGKDMRSPTYVSWQNMKARCTNPKRPNYANYGGRSIRVCKRWGESFVAFLQDMGCRPEGMTLDRINNDSGYYKANCRWATPSQQNRNKRKRRAA
jgi:hypothetical protein